VDNTADDDISITTGSAATTIHGAGNATPADNDAISVNATALANDTLLTLTGGADFTVTGLTGDLTAAALTGTLDVTTVDNTVDDDISIPTASAATAIHGTGNATPADNDAISVNAAALANDTLLTLTGGANFTVTGLTGNLDAAALPGALDVTTVDNTVDDDI